MRSNLYPVTMSCLPSKVVSARVLPQARYVRGPMPGLPTRGSALILRYCPNLFRPKEALLLRDIQLGCSLSGTKASSDLSVAPFADSSFWYFNLESSMRGPGAQGKHMMSSDRDRLIMNLRVS